MYKSKSFFTYSANLLSEEINLFVEKLKNKGLVVEDMKISRLNEDAYILLYKTVKEKSNKGGSYVVE